MASFLLAWEMGGGLGHAARLKPIAEELARRGHRCTLVLRDLVQTDTVLRGTPFVRLQAPIWLHRVAGAPEAPVSLAEIMLGNGYLRPPHVEALCQGWRAAIDLTRADVVVADYAPTAVLAARLAGLPSASVGIGFYVPPDRVPVPPFRDGEQIAIGRVERAEGQVLDSVNAALRARGRPEFERLASLFRGDRALLCTWPELDHYGRGDLPDGDRWHGPSFLASAGAAPDWPAGDGPKVFAYLKSGHPDHAAVLRALDHAGCRVLCYLPEMAGGLAAPVLSTRIRYSLGPVDLARAFAGCQLVVCHAGEATLAQSLLAGVPLLMLPMQAEQFQIARRVARTGAGLNVAGQRRPVNFGALIKDLIDRPEPAAAARAFKAKYAGFDPAAQTAQMADAFEEMIAGPAA